ncbi:MAG: glycosyltransferase [Alphaproteobacteria bacterium]|nr:glycosyltransferase [Alphaproteobacteria bacterium]
MSQPDVSVIIPSFNTSETLGAAIKSAMQQTGVRVEVIVVDDCSQDNSAAIAESFPDHSVKLFQHAENRGPGAARNTAIENATGTWLAMLDSDDTIESDRLHNMIGLAEANGTQIVVDNLNINYGNDCSNSPMFPPDDWARLSSISLADYILGNTLFASTFNLGYLKPIIRRDFVVDHSLSYDEKLRIGEDYLFAATALSMGAICGVHPVAGYNYHVRDGSISRVLKLHHLHDMKTADTMFLEQAVLKGAEIQAFKKRSKSIDEAVSFLKLIEHLKARAPVKALRAVLSDPMAARHLRMPIAARWQRWVAN